jgi:hypothetical protein
VRSSVVVGQQLVVEPARERQQRRQNFDVVLPCELLERLIVGAG